MNDILELDLIMIGTKVKIIEANIVGRVDAIIQERTGFQYRIKWWHGDSKSTAWCYPEEIMAIL